MYLGDGTMADINCYQEAKFGVNEINLTDPLAL